MKQISKLILIALVTSTPNLVSADAWQEREYLERWILQTESITQILDQAKLSSNEKSRSKLNYEALKKANENIVLKVKHYLNSPTIPFETFKLNEGFDTNEK